MDIEKNLIAFAAEVYDVDESIITLDTNISRDLSNQSLMMVAFISCIEDEYDIEIELQDASQLETIGDYVEKVKELLA